MGKRRISYAGILFAINAYVCWRVFGLEWSQRMDSKEGAYIGISRHILASWPDLSWWPAWYGGIPFHKTYPPLMHMLTALAATVLGVSAPRAYHIVTGLFYCAAPVFAYLMVARLSGRRFASFCAALLYSVVLSGRLGTLIGDGPHIAALAVMPVAIYCLDVALERRRPVYYGLASLSFIAVVYTDWRGVFALAAMMLCYLTAGRPWRDWTVTAALVGAAYLVGLPWIPPSLIHISDVKAVPLAALVFAGTKFLMHRLRAPGWLQMLVLFATLMSWIGLGRPEAGFGIALVLGMGAALALGRAPTRFAHGAAAVFLVFAAALVYRAHYCALGLFSGGDITSTLEYRVASWFDEHMSGSRVMVPGSIQFWFQAFTETPQSGGGLEPGYGTRPGACVNDVVRSLLWLKAFGAQAIEERSSKFQGVLPELWREGDDAIYRVPERNNSLAHVMRGAHLTARPIDIEQVRTYVDAIDDPALPEAGFVWRTRHSAEILTSAKPNHIVSVQVTYDRGWRAQANGREARVYEDGLGFLVIEPHCDGECRIELVYDGGREARVSRWLRGITILCWVIWILISRKPPFTGFWARFQAR